MPVEVRDQFFRQESGVMYSPVAPALVIGLPGSTVLSQSVVIGVYTCCNEPRQRFVGVQIFQDMKNSSGAGPDRR